MKSIEQLAFPRAALLGNPSDGYFGKTIAFTFRDFRASVKLMESPRLRFVSEDNEQGIEFGSQAEFMHRFANRCYGGSMRLLHAAAIRFFRHCHDTGASISRQNFSMLCHTSIPSLVGLAGSSAIAMAALKALSEFYEVSIPKHRLAQLCLEVETNELGLPAGLQDRVAQAYDGLVYMDFDMKWMEQQNYGRYEPMDTALLKNVFVAWDEFATEGTEVPHSRLRERWNAGDTLVRETLAEIASLVDPGRQAMESGDAQTLHTLMNRNFDLRERIVPIHPAHKNMVETARAAGASAKFAGSGGAIVGFFEDEAHFQRLAAAMDSIGSSIIKPTIT